MLKARYTTSIIRTNVKAADYNYFEGVTIRNTEIGIWAGTQFIASSKGLTVKNCWFENVNIGIFTNYSGSNNFYIADNYFMGRDETMADQCTLAAMETALDQGSFFDMLAVLASSDSVLYRTTTGGQP